MFRAPGTIAPETGTLPARRIWSGRWYRVMASGDFPALLSVIGRHDHHEAAGIVVKDTGSALFGGRKACESPTCRPGRAARWKYGRSPITRLRRRARLAA